MHYCVGDIQYNLQAMYCTLSAADKYCIEFILMVQNWFAWVPLGHVNGDLVPLFKLFSGIKRNIAYKDRRCMQVCNPN